MVDSRQRELTLTRQVTMFAGLRSTNSRGSFANLRASAAIRVLPGFHQVGAGKARKVANGASGSRVIANAPLGGSQHVTGVCHRSP
jgi:hypothetical protein